MKPEAKKIKEINKQKLRLRKLFYWPCEFFSAVWRHRMGSVGYNKAAIGRTRPQNDLEEKRLKLRRARRRWSDGYETVKPLRKLRQKRQSPPYRHSHARLARILGSRCCRCYCTAVAQARIRPHLAESSAVASSLSARSHSLSLVAGREIYNKSLQ